MNYKIYGANGKYGEPGQSVDVTYSTPPSTDGNIQTFAFGGAGGGIGPAGGAGNGDSGGVGTLGGNASANTAVTYDSASPAVAYSTASGGAGGYGIVEIASPGGGVLEKGTGGAGGTAGATARAANDLGSARAAGRAQGGTGNSGSFTGYLGGAGGVATINGGAISASGVSAYASAVLYGGTGGGARSGAQGGAAQNAALFNAAVGSATGGTLDLNQTTLGGNGGYSGGGKPGIAGSASSTLSHVDPTQGTMIATLLEGTSSATGGNGGGGGGGSSGMPGADATALLSLTGANTVSGGGANAAGGRGGDADGTGNGGLGGSANATAESVSSSATDNVSAITTVVGGAGGGANLNSTGGGTAGPGGDATSAIATATQTAATAGQTAATVTETGGAGGGNGAGESGGAAGGDATGVLATASGFLAVATASQIGGAGGSGGGQGAGSTMLNDVRGTATSGGTVSLIQYARGGAGGYSLNGTAGTPGAARSTLEPASPYLAGALLNGSSTGHGGMGGAGGGTSGGATGGNGYGYVILTGANTVTTDGVSYGGSGGSSLGTGNAGHGGAAYSYSKAVSTTTGIAAVTADAGARGGAGSNNPSETGSGGVGGSSKKAVAIAQALNATDTGELATARAVEVGGAGGSGGEGITQFGRTGGDGGAVTGTSATASGGSASAYTFQQGGAGGGSYSGGSGGAGASSTLTNAVYGTTQGGTLALTQIAIGGAGGNGRASAGGGAGGAAQSNLTFTDNKPNRVNAISVTGTVVATGGAGGADNSAFGAAGNFGDGTITLTGASGVTAVATASGGAGGGSASGPGLGAGGNATAVATGTATGMDVGGTATVTANATGGGGGAQTAGDPPLAGDATATATATTALGQQAAASANANGGGASDTASTTATTAVTPGSAAVTGVKASTTATGAGSVTAGSTANIAGLAPGLNGAGLGDYAFALGFQTDPVPDYNMIPAILNDPANANIGTALGSSQATILGYSTQGGYAQIGADGSETLTSTVTYTLNADGLPGELIAGMVSDDPNVSLGADYLVNFTATINGTIVQAESFTPPNAVDPTNELPAFFNDNALDLGVFPAAGLEVVALTLTLDTASSGSGLGASILLGVSPEGFWSGASSTDLGTGGNWQSLAVPGDTSNLTFATLAGGTLTGAISGFNAVFLGSTAWTLQGGDMTLGGYLDVGVESAGSLNILGGATITASSAAVGGYFGSPDGTGAIEIEGAGSTLNLAGALSVGYGLSGRFTLGAQTVLSAPQGVEVAGQGYFISEGLLTGDVTIDGSGSFSNFASGTVTGTIAVAANASVGNFGTLDGAVTLAGQDQVVTGAGAVFKGGITSTGGANALEIATGPYALTGFNAPGSPQYSILQIDSGVTVTTDVSDVLTGITLNNQGVLDLSAFETTSAVNNSGDWNGDIALANGAPLVNTGLISGSGEAVITSAGGPASVSNSGVIDPATYGVDLTAGGSVTNTAGATIDGSVAGVLITGGPGTVTNAGTISGGGMDAVTLAAGFANRVVLDPGAVFAGLVDGGNTIGAAAASTLELGSTGAQGSLTGVGSEFVNFAQLLVDSGAAWRFTGANSLAAGTSLTDLGAITVIGTQSVLSDNGTFVAGDTGMGGLTISGGGTATAAGATIANTASASGSSVNVVGTGSVWRVDGLLDVGAAGSGALQLSGGATVTAGTFDAGNVAAAVAQIGLSGAGTELSVTGAATVADDGTGVLSVLSGATFAAASLTIGSQGDSSGAVVVSGAGSQVNLTGSLNIGTANGTGDLTVGPGAAISAQAVFQQGQVVLEGGLLDPTVQLINQGQTAGGFGTIAAGDIVDEGAIQAGGNKGSQKLLIVQGTVLGGGTLTVDGTLPGSVPAGIMQINAGGTLELSGAVLNAATTTFTDNLTPQGTYTVNNSVIDVNFVDSAGVLLLDDIAGFGGTIASYQAGDSFVVHGGTLSGLGVSNGDTLTVSDSGSLAGAGGIDQIIFGAPVSAAGFKIINGSTIQAQVPCFARGTRIETERGMVAVEDLRVADRVVTKAGSIEPIVWIGQRSVNCARHPNPKTVWPVRVSAGAFGETVPERDLFLSPDHAVFVNNVLVPVKLLINGTSIAQAKRRDVTYYHVELARHEVILAEGLTVESYLDMGDRANFGGPGRAIRLFPDFAARLSPDTALVWETRGVAPLVMAGKDLAAARKIVAVNTRDHRPRSVEPRSPAS